MEFNFDLALRPLLKYRRLKAVAEDDEDVLKPSLSEPLEPLPQDDDAMPLICEGLFCALPSAVLEGWDIILEFELLEMFEPVHVLMESLRLVLGEVQDCVR